MSTAFSGEIVINAPRQKTWKVVTSALLSVMSECPDGYSEYMNKPRPLALEKIKQLAEAA